MESSARMFASITRHIEPHPAPLNAEIHLPGSKSFTNRALLLAAVSQGTSSLHDPLLSDDTEAGLRCLQAWGIGVTIKPHQWCIQGAPNRAAGGRIHLASAGTLARFMPGLLASAGEMGRVVLDASPQLCARPLSPLVTALQQAGLRVTSASPTGSLPLAIESPQRPAHVTPHVRIGGSVSSQFLSGLLLCGPRLTRGLRISRSGALVQPDYVRMTMAVMQRFGANVQADAALRHFSVSTAPYQACQLHLEADASTACYFFALAAVCGGEVRVKNLVGPSLQPDLQVLDVLVRMGCQVTRGPAGIWVRRAPGAPLRGGLSICCRPFSDQLPTLAALALFADAPVSLTGAAHTRWHESDRVAAMCHNLRLLGAHVTEQPDGLTIVPDVSALHGGHLCAFDDHRIAMALTLVGTQISGISLTDASCVSKTCPAYFSLLAQAGIASVAQPSH